MIIVNILIVLIVFSFLFKDNLKKIFQIIKPKLKELKKILYSYLNDFINIKDREKLLSFNLSDEKARNKILIEQNKILRDRIKGLEGFTLISNSLKSTNHYNLSMTKLKLKEAHEEIEKLKDRIKDLNKIACGKIIKGALLKKDTSDDIIEVKSYAKELLK